MNDISNPGSDAVAPLEIEMAPRTPNLQTRRELAAFLDIPYKHLTFVLYTLDRASAYRVLEIPKSSGGIRTLHAVNSPWKGLQRTALDKLQAYWQPTPYAHGFVVGKSILTNAALHSRTKRIVKVDIKDFFPSINFARVQGMFCAPPFNFGKEVAVTLAQLACLDGGVGQLPQGGVLSPYISNMLCRRLDRRLANLAREHHCRFSRYADDMTFSTNDLAKFDANALLNATYQIIESEHFQPNRDKTRILTPRERQIVTGIVVNKGVNVNRKYLRNVRATLRNCERYGIESQVVKPSAFKDERNSRIGLVKETGSFLSGDVTVSADEACCQFLWHLWGKLQFIGSVVESRGQRDCPEIYGRVLAYERLIERFFLLIDRDSRFAKLRAAVLREIRRHTRVDDRLRQQGERTVIRAKALDEHRTKSSTIEAIRSVEAVADRVELDALVTKFAEVDPRFFRPTLSVELETARREAINILRYPAFDRPKVETLILSLRNSSDGLGVLTHSPSDPNKKHWFSGTDALRIVASQYDPVVYCVPFELRDLFEQYIGALEEIVKGTGPAVLIDVPAHEGLYGAMIALKAGTRFGKSSQADDASSIKRLVSEVVASAHKDAARSKATLIAPDVAEVSLYTHVQSVRNALTGLLHSMLKNTQGTEVSIRVDRLEGHQFYEIVVKDDVMDPITGFPSRTFVHGKLSHVIRVTNGICNYWLEAEFTDAGRALIDMHSGRVLDDEPRFSSGFVHRLRFERAPGQERP